MVLEALWLTINLFSGEPADIDVILGVVSDPEQEFIPVEFQILELLNNILKE